MAYKTKYIPENKEKYVGDPTMIVCRSLWERSVCKFCDLDENVLKWSSEGMAIPYNHPIKNKISNYIEHLFVQIKKMSDILNIRRVGEMESSPT